MTSPRSSQTKTNGGGVGHGLLHREAEHVAVEAAAALDVADDEVGGDGLEGHGRRRHAKLPGVDRGGRRRSRRAHAWRVLAPPPSGPGRAPGASRPPGYVPWAGAREEPGQSSAPRPPGNPPGEPRRPGRPLVCCVHGARMGEQGRRGAAGRGPRPGPDRAAAVPRRAGAAPAGRRGCAWPWPTRPPSSRRRAGRCIATCCASGLPPSRPAWRRCRGPRRDGRGLRTAPGSPHCSLPAFLLCSVSRGLRSGPIPPRVTVETTHPLNPPRRSSVQPRERSTTHSLSRFTGPLRDSRRACRSTVHRKSPVQRHRRGHPHATSRPWRRRRRSSARSTARPAAPAGFAFVEYGERTHAEEAIKRFDGQLFMGRPLAVSEARARDDRGPSGRRARAAASVRRDPAAWAAPVGPPRPGGYAPRPPGEGGYAGRPGGYRSQARRPAADRRGHRPPAQLRPAGAAQGQEGPEGRLRAEGARSARPDSRPSSPAASTGSTTKPRPAPPATTPCRTS